MCWYSISQTGRVRHLSEGSTATTNRTLVSYADAFHCIRLSVDKVLLAVLTDTRCSRSVLQDVQPT